MFGSSSIFVPVIWCNNAISIRNLLLIWKEIHFTGEWHNSWAETNGSEFCQRCSITGKVPHIIKIRQTITKLNVADLFHSRIICQKNHRAHWRVCPSVVQQKPGSCSCCHEQRYPFPHYCGICDLPSVSLTSWTTLKLCFRSEMVHPFLVACQGPDSSCNGICKTCAKMWQVRQFAKRLCWKKKDIWWNI